MDKTYRDEFTRLFVVENLPGSMSPADAHLQIIDNYVDGTRFRFRRVRVPGNREWTRLLQQRLPIFGGKKIAQFVLDEAEYRALGAFEGNEIRKNRYFTEIDGLQVAFDIYLGALSGLTTARAEAESAGAIAGFVFPYTGIEVTTVPMFEGANLFRRSFADVETVLARIASEAREHQSLISEIAGEEE
jgi:CYTH domain-containing protein